MCAGKLHCFEIETDMNRIIRMIAVCCAALTYVSCSSEGTGHRPDEGGQRPGQGSELVFRENPDWKLSHSQDVITDEYGFNADVDIISVKSIDNETYWLDVITADNFRNWYGGDIEAYIKDEPNYYTGEDYKGSVDIQFDRMRSGNWLAVAFGVDSKGAVNGDYAVLRFTIDEDQPSEDFNRWLGRWTVKGMSKTEPQKEISYDLNISSSDADFLFYVEGWESGKGLENDMTGYVFETQYDRFTKTMLFKSVYLETETISGKEYDLCLYGNFIYDGSMGFSDMGKGDEQTVCDNIIIAESSRLSEDGRSATVDGLHFDFIHENKTYQTKLTSMQYFDYPLDASDLGLYVKNSSVPVFPLTMTKVQDNAQVSAAAAGSRVNAGVLRICPRRHSAEMSAYAKAGCPGQGRISVSRSVRKPAVR